MFSLLVVLHIFWQYFSQMLNITSKPLENEDVVTKKNKSSKKQVDATQMAKSKTRNDLVQQPTSIRRGKDANNWLSYMNRNEKKNYSSTITSKDKSSSTITSNIKNDEPSSNNKKKKIDKISPNLPECVAIDCEMVGIGYGGNENMLARVSLVDKDGEILYDTFVKAREPVVDYRTKVSGVRPNDMKNGKDFRDVQYAVSSIIKNKILVGHALQNDLQVLFLNHPKRLIRDTSYIKVFRDLMPRHGTPSLRKLALVILKKNIQSGEHSSVEDARAAMELYIKFQVEIENNFKSY